MTELGNKRAATGQSPVEARIRHPQPRRAQLFSFITAGR